MAFDTTPWTPSETAAAADLAAAAASEARAAVRAAAVLVMAIEAMRAETAELALELTSAADLMSVMRSRSSRNWDWA